MGNIFLGFILFGWVVYFQVRIDALRLIFEVSIIIVLALIIAITNQINYWFVIEK